MGNKIVIPAPWLNEIERRIMSAEAPVDFVPELASEWSKSARTVWRYVARVRARLAARVKAQDPDADRELTRGLLLRAYRTAEKGTPERGPDAKGMVAAARTFGELTGVIGPRKVEITGKDGGAIAMAAQVVLMPALEHDASAVSRPTDTADAPGALASEPGSAIALPRLDSE